MKPALLYLKNYIDQNYNNTRYQQTEKKSTKQSQVNKHYSEELIFKEKKKFDWQSTNKKEFYFKAPKSFNVSKIKEKIILQERKSHQTFNSIETHSKVSINTDHVQNSTKKQFKNITLQNHGSAFKNKAKNKKNHLLGSSNYDKSIQNQIRFVISPPKKVEKRAQQSFQLFNQAKNPQKNQKMMPFQTKDFEEIESEAQTHKKILQQKQNRIFLARKDHTKITCRSMNKIGYNNLSEYLIEMKKFQKMAKKQIKEACYYPLDCMKPPQQSAETYERDAMIKKKYFQKKVEEFAKIIDVQQGFTVQNIEKELRSTLSSNGHKRPKSNFSKAKESKKKDEKFEQKGKKFLFQYDQIIICNCANKRFFTFPLSEDINYNSFLKLATPVLETPLSKENNYLQDSYETSVSYGLYFCSLFSTLQSQKEHFFWIGKPIHFYQKDQIINVIDNFLCEINGVSAIENEKIWIVDFHGRNSFIMKSMLIKSNQMKQQINHFVQKKENSRESKRASFSRNLSFDISESLLNFMFSSSFENNEQICLRKQRNNISTKGPFQMVYESTENLR